MRKCEIIEALCFDDDSRERVCDDNIADIQDGCEQENQNWRYELSHAQSRPAGNTLMLKEGRM